MKRTAADALADSWDERSVVRQSSNVPYSVKEDSDARRTRWRQLLAAQQPQKLLPPSVTQASKSSPQSPQTGPPRAPQSPQTGSSPRAAFQVEDALSRIKGLLPELRDDAINSREALVTCDVLRQLHAQLKAQFLGDK